MDRLLKVTAFTVSVYSCVYRPFLPFRSPAGETGEIVAPDKGIRALGEKARSAAGHWQCTATSGTMAIISETCCRILLKVQGFLLKLQKLKFHVLAMPSTSTLFCLCLRHGFPMSMCWCVLQCDDNPGVNALHVEGRGWVLSGDEMNVIEYRGLYANIR